MAVPAAARPALQGETAMMVPALSTLLAKFREAAAAAVL
jgi:hypothetical protein